MWTGEEVVWVFILIAEGAFVVILMLPVPLKQLGSTAKMSGCVFGGASLLSWGKGRDSGIKCGPVDGVYVFDGFM